MTDRSDKRDDAGKARKGKVTSLGLASDTDPIYQGGWNFLIGKNLNPNLPSKNPDEESSCR